MWSFMFIEFQILIPLKVWVVGNWGIIVWFSQTFPMCSLDHRGLDSVSTLAWLWKPCYYLCTQCSLYVEQHNRRERERCILWSEMHLVSLQKLKFQISITLNFKVYIQTSCYLSSSHKIYALPFTVVLHTYTICDLESSGEFIE